MNGQGAPANNNNAASHGLYASSPERRIKITATASSDDLAICTQDLAAGALWIAEALTLIDGKSERVVKGLNQIIPLYASVAQELEQTAAEISGEIGIKPSSLGALTDDQYDGLMLKQSKSLELIINQCVGAYQRLKIGEEIRQAVEKADGQKVLDLPSGLLGYDERGALSINPVLKYLAGHMRTAKRVAREMAANRAWKLRGAERNDDLATRVLNSME